MPLIETGPEAPGGRRRDSNSVVQALMMIFAWVGGAAAAVAVAYLILQYIKPEAVQDDIDPVSARAGEREQVEPRVRQEITKRKPKPARSKPAPVRPKVADRPKVDRRNFQRPSMPGLVYRYFENESFRMQDFGKVAASQSGVLLDIDDLTEADEATGLQLEGFWETKTEQACDFTLDSTNSGRLWIDDQLVLDNTTLFQPGPVRGTRTIQPGVHNVRVEFLLTTQGGSFQLSVAGAGASNRMSMERLLRPFESANPSSDESLQYKLAKHPKPERASSPANSEPEAVRERASAVENHQMLTVLIEGFTASTELKPTPRPSVVTSRLKKLTKQSAARIADKKGNVEKMTLIALANSIEKEARGSADSDSRFVTLLEARRLHVVTGDFKAAFSITDELSQEFEYDYWKDALALFSDVTARAGKSSLLQKAVCDELAPVISKAQNELEFEIAAKLAAGGEMLATKLKDQEDFQKYQEQIEEFEQLAKITKQARVAAKKLVDDPDDKFANRSMGIFFLTVSKDWNAAMRCFARSGNKDCEFIAEYDQNSSIDAGVAAKLVDCWMRVGKKVDSLKDLANERASEIQTQAARRAKEKTLKDLKSGLDGL